MASSQQSKNTKSSSASSKSKTSSAVLSGAKKNEVLAKNRRKRNIWSVVLFAIGLLITAIALIGNSAAENMNMWDHIHGFFCGVFGATVFFIGPFIIYIAIMISLDKGRSTLTARIFQILLFIFMLSAAIQIIFIGQIASPETEGFGETVSELYNNGMNLSGGGVCALLIGFPLLLLGRIGATIAIILIIFVVIMLVANINLMDFLKIIAKPFVKLGGYIKDKRTEFQEESRILREERERLEKEEAASAENDEAEAKTISAKAKSFDEMEKDIKSGELAHSNEEAKAIVKEQKQETDEYLVKIGAKSPIVPPRLTDEDYKRNAEKIQELSESRKEDEQLTLDERNKKGNSSEKTDVSEIEKAISDYNHEIEEKNKNKGIVVDTVVNTAKDGQQVIDQVITSVDDYTLPPVTLLSEVKKKVTDENINAEIENNANILVNSLKSFGVETKYLGAVRGPSVTRYELQPAPGVKISKITGLVDDIALNLATAGVRIEAPIPNKAAVGIEVPNKEKETVFIREMIDSEDFRKCNSKLGSALGKNISGEVVICDISEMPHILIAGTTGSGKSVCVNSIIMSILYRSTPEEVRLVMIDPKAVEFMIYNGIAHLLLPVVTDPKKAAGSLAWACTEMDKRYNILSENNVRDIKAYNKLAETREDLQPMPSIVIFIDELADLMMCAKNDVEASICRLAQKARAAGMHLVVATQRPSVDVITGLIKSNIPSRIALKVAQQVDSRTIIDVGGAEKLLGKGDMLYKSVVMPKPIRVQGCWVSDEEVERVTEFIKNKYTLEYDENVIDEVDRQSERVGSDDKSKSAFDGDLDMNDEKLDEAIDVVFANNGASTSALQRALKVGYGRAARLVDIMEKMGIVGPPDGNKPRQLLMSRESWYEMKLNQQDQE